MTRVRQLSDTVLAIELSPSLDPLAALGRLQGRPGRVLLHSAGTTRGCTYLVADPLETVRFSNGRITFEGSLDRTAIQCADPFSALSILLEAWSVPPPPADLPFAGGLLGFLGYEVADVLEALPAGPLDDVGTPDAWFGVYDMGIVWTPDGAPCQAVARVLPGRSLQETTDRLQQLAVRMTDPNHPASPRCSHHGPIHPGDSRGRTDRSHPISSLSRESFMSGVKRVQRFIRAGDLFQANLTRRITAQTSLSGVEMYHQLLNQSPAAYSAYLDTGAGEIASISPELFLSLRSGEVSTRPIKGTASRHRNPNEDRVLASALESSAKDRAENVMIVDLMRNDLSRVCVPGSVVVPELAALETHPTVHHLVSTVRGQLRPDADPVALLRATFPGGSITGAPKIRAMEILRELEPVRRGVYTGALGILHLHGNLDLSIAIRTAVVRDGRVHYGTGGGITLASDPAREWQETEDKAGAFLRALEIA